VTYAWTVETTAVGTSGFVETFNASSWSAPVQPDPNGNGLTAVSCPSATFCAAVDNLGQALTFNGSAWSAPEAIDTTRNALHAVSCASSSFCVAGDVGGNGVVSNGAACSRPMTINHFSNSEAIGGISCPSQTGTFGGGAFRVAQASRGANKGLATLSLLQGVVKGAPAYSVCTRKGKSTDASAAATSHRVLQLLHASARGKFRTAGRYSAATVRGTAWSLANRCDGTLTRVSSHTVAVTDFVRHVTVVLHAGQSYLARAPARR
jgi:hypothetical protein